MEKIKGVIRMGHKLYNIGNITSVSFENGNLKIQDRSYITEMYECSTFEFNSESFTAYDKYGEVTVVIDLKPWNYCGDCKNYDVEKSYCKKRNFYISSKCINGKYVCFEPKIEFDERMISLLESLNREIIEINSRIRTIENKVGLIEIRGEKSKTKTKICLNCANWKRVYADNVGICSIDKERTTQSYKCICWEEKPEEVENEVYD